MLTFERCSTRTDRKIGKALCLRVQDGSGFQHRATDKSKSGARRKRSITKLLFQNKY